MVEKYLNEFEIAEKSVIMIEFNDGTTRPYYVDVKRAGGITGATMLLGHLIEDIIKDSKLWPITTNGSSDRYYIKNTGHVNVVDTRVQGYRQLTPGEKVKWCEKIPPEQKELIKALYK